MISVLKDQTLRVKVFKKIFITMWTTDKTFTPYLLLNISVLCPHCKQGSVKTR